METTAEEAQPDTHKSVSLTSQRKKNKAVLVLVTEIQMPF
jgi:hypothetical protein